MELFDMVKESESALDAFLTDPNLRELLFDTNDNGALIELLNEREKNDSKKPQSSKSFMYGSVEDNFDENDLLVKLSISSDEMSSWVEISPLLKGVDSNSIEELIYEQLSNRGVVYGIRKQQIKRISSSPIYDKPFLVAQGKKPIEGKEGAIKFYFNMNVSLIPILNNDYGVDPANPDFVNYVKSGTLLCTSSHTTNDFTGYNLRGRVIKPIEGGIDHIITGNNVKTSNDGCRWYASEDGEVVLKNNILSVVPVLRLKNVDANTGDIDFDGSVYINGNVEFGKFVKAKNNIVIGGVLQDANIEAGGNLAVGKGMKGSKGTYVHVFGSVRTPFAEYVNMRAEGEIHADVILGGEIDCDCGVYALGNKGFIVGGKVSAREIFANEIGNYSGAKTTVEITSLSNMELEILEKNKDLENWLERMKKLKLVIRDANQARQQVLAKVYEQIEQQINEIEQSLDNIQRRIDVIRSKYSFEIQGKKSIYSNVALVFKGRSTVNERVIMYSRLYYKYGEVKVDSLR